ncbi:hypothetical protein NLI96_g3694 [Meripilus lineatus]|uniref:Uncharacterized protein n=1 Tax=Meripilus lineatus TaxID=2056292 RepID=A0AAD5YGC9_9APHY|nr:hypothetical protein NLI96_g3694 [Physisporinus lineatus]
MSVVASHNAYDESKSSSLSRLPSEQPEQAGYDEDIEEADEVRNEKDDNRRLQELEGSWTVVEGPHVEASVKLAR